CFGYPLKINYLHETSDISCVSHVIGAKAIQDIKEISDYFINRMVSESSSHTDNNADSRGTNCLQS
ncbi:hypothetical protein, partial [Escherichia coli]|uniref:hypothetical protein n=1 Tax=Escherichia coli TaxID=562 RepID=UPI0038510883